MSIAKEQLLQIITEINLSSVADFYTFFGERFKLGATTEGYKKMQIGMRWPTSAINEKKIPPVRLDFIAIPQN